MIEINFTPFPILTTDRLVLRPLKTTDDTAIFIHRSDDRVNKYLENWRHSAIEETQAFITRVQNEITNNATILWVLTKKGDDKFLGTVCLWKISKDEDKAETGYTLEPEFQGMGYMNEALAEIIKFGMNTIKLKTIEAYTHKNNESSIRLLVKNRFVLDTSRTAELDKGNDRIIFVLTNEKR